MKWGDNDSSARRTLWVAGALFVLTCLSILSGMYDDAQARLAERGSWCERCGPHPSGLAMWSNDGGETWHD